MQMRKGEPPRRERRRLARAWRRMLRVSAAAVGVNLEVAHGFYGVLEGAVQGYLMPMLNDQTHDTQLELADAARVSLGFGTRL